METIKYFCRLRHVGDKERLNFQLRRATRYLCIYSKNILQAVLYNMVNSIQIIKVKNQLMQNQANDFHACPLIFGFSSVRNTSETIKSMAMAENHTQIYAIIDSHILILVLAKGMLYMLTNAYIMVSVAYHFEFSFKVKIQLMQNPAYDFHT